jgi:hypothetical protein
VTYLPVEEQQPPKADFAQAIKSESGFQGLSRRSIRANLLYFLDPPHVLSGETPPGLVPDVVHNPKAL